MRTELGEVERLAAAGGRLESGLLATQQEAVRDKYSKLKEDYSAQLAIETGRAKEQAIESAMAQAPAYTAYGAEQQAQVYQAQQQQWQALEQQHELTQQGRERAYGTGLAEQFSEYQSDLQAATSAAEFTAAQQKLAEEGKTLAWAKATEQYDKAYEYYMSTLKDEDAAKQAAWEAALQEYNKLYGSILLDAQQEYNWVTQQRQWEVERWIEGQASNLGWGGVAASIVESILGMFPTPG